MVALPKYWSNVKVIFQFRISYLFVIHSQCEQVGVIREIQIEKILAVRMPIPFTLLSEMAYIRNARVLREIFAKTAK